MPRRGMQRAKTGGARATPRASLGRVIDDLGSTLLEVVSGVIDVETEIETVVIHDALDEAMPMHRALVLGIGLDDTSEIVALLHTLAAEGASALLLRTPRQADPAVLAASEHTGVPVLALARGASWAQLTTMLRSLIAEGDVGAPDDDSIGGAVSSDLFTLANAIATLLDAPVTIEDRSSRVIAFSGHQEDADFVRVATILGRKVPDRFFRQLEERGVFQEMYRSADPIEVAPVVAAAGQRSSPRVALAVRAGDEILGSIWAEVRTPLSPERMRAFKDSAGLVALQILRLRAGADVERRVRADLLATLLEGGTGAADAAERLRIENRRTVVIALTTTLGRGEPSVDVARTVAERQRVADAFAVHLGAVAQRSAVAVVGGVIYAVVGTQPEHDDADVRAARVADDFLVRLGAGAQLRVGVGTIADGIAEIPSSRANADRALRVLQRSPELPSVGVFSTLQVETLLDDLRDLMRSRGDRLFGPVAALFEHDREKGTQFVDTLHAWLDSFGDINEAANRIYAHPNTFRYRLRRLGEISGLDLDDPDVRFGALVQLHLLANPPSRNPTDSV